MSGVGGAERHARTVNPAPVRGVLLEERERRNRSRRITTATSAFALPLSPVNMLPRLYGSDAARIARPCDFFF